MKQTKEITQKTLQALLSSSHQLSKKYGGKHVFVVDQEVVPLGKGGKDMAKFKRLKQKHGKSPVLVFVPRPGTSYILIIQ